MKHPEKMVGQRIEQEDGTELLIVDYDDRDRTFNACANMDRWESNVCTCSSDMWTDHVTLTESEVEAAERHESQAERGYPHSEAWSGGFVENH